MKYVALLSGGKDSCYNLIHCAQNGHELVAAASLRPEQGKEELDSYLYQTVGQDAIELVARALDVPLYRQVISGAAVEQGSEYGARNAAQSGGVPGDETEDLYELLSTVKISQPNVQGVSVGAILSNYQRVRVEHVCRRLGLTPLCYLWQRNQAELLSEMIETRMEAVLIKVAGIGLATKHLGKTLAQMQPTLEKLNQLYGSHICGEGGEYETLTLDCPLFKSRIVLADVETVIHSDSDFAVVAYLRVNNATLEPRTPGSQSILMQPPLLEENFQHLHDIIVESELTADSTSGIDAPMDAVTVVQSHALNISDKQVGHWVAITEITGTIKGHSDISLENEVRECFHRLQETLHKYALELSNCTNINIFISSMDLFSRVNAIYATFFGTSPPARACVAVDLPAPMRVKLDCIAYLESSSADRQALHVQGLSYWAPANIGPYSQAITADERIFISGQIGMIPSNLNLPSPPSLALETALSFQHVSRIVGALQSNSSGGWQGHTQGTLYWLARSKDVPLVKKAAAAYLQDSCAPALFVVVPTLPKGASVEKQVILHTGQYTIKDEDEETVVQSIAPRFTQGDHTGPYGARVHYEFSYFGDINSTVALLCFQGDARDAVAWLKDVPEFRSFWERILSIRLFHKRSTEFCYTTCEELFRDTERPPITTIPSRHISTRDHDDWDYTMLIIGA